MPGNRSNAADPRTFPRPSLEGQVLGAYRLVEQIGAGGMAVIYRAYDPNLDRSVAIKLLSPDLIQDPEFLVRFRIEARSVARLHHPNILPIYGYGEQQGMSYFVMQLVEGGTLGELMGERLEINRALALIVQLADALHHAHEQGIVHRDVKPTNVLMARPHWPLLADFGIARVLEQNVALTRLGSAPLGTPHYMAPEQAAGKPVSPLTDQYALGVLLYEMLTGRTPFQGDTPMAIAYQHIYSSVPDPCAFNAHITTVLRQVLLQALAKRPTDRFSDMAAFSQALLSSAGPSVVKTHAPVLTPRPGSDDSATKGPPRKTAGHGVPPASSSATERLVRGSLRPAPGEAAKRRARE